MGGSWQDRSVMKHPSFDGAGVGRFGAMSTPAAVRVWGSNWALYRHMWHADAAGNLLQPLLYLLGMGIGVGALVDTNAQAESSLGGVSYLAFLAPALIATTAMMTSATRGVVATARRVQVDQPVPRHDGHAAASGRRRRRVRPVGRDPCVHRFGGRRRRPRAVRRNAVVGTATGDRVRRAHRLGVRDAGGRVDVDP